MSQYLLWQVSKKTIVLYEVYLIKSVVGRFLSVNLGFTVFLELEQKPLRLFKSEVNKSKSTYIPASWTLKFQILTGLHFKNCSLVN